MCGGLSIMWDVYLLCGMPVYYVWWSVYYVGCLPIMCGGLSIMCGGLSIMCGGLSIMCGGLSIMYGGLSIMCGGLSIMCGGLFIMYGGLSIMWDACLLCVVVCLLCGMPVYYVWWSVILNKIFVMIHWFKLSWRVCLNSETFNVYFNKDITLQWHIYHCIINLSQTYYSQHGNNNINLKSNIQCT